MKVATWDNYVQDVEREGVRQLRTEARRRCERCGANRQVVITETGDGWELWTFECGHSKRYRGQQ